MRDWVEAPELTEEQEREMQERIDKEETIKKLEKTLEKINEEVENTDGDPYERIDNIRFYIKEYEND